MTFGKLLVAGYLALAAHVLTEDERRKRRESERSENLRKFIEQDIEKKRLKREASQALAAATTMQDIYKHLKLSGDKIRVLKIKAGAKQEPIRCEMSVHEPGAVDYEALSYTWGDGPPIHPINVFNVEHKISENLLQAITHLRPAEGEPRALWIDALCLNQNSTDEKNAQIPRMASIYNHANKALVWLGPATTESARAMAYFNRIGDGDAGSSLLEASFKNHQNYWLDFGDGLLDRAWWGRAWIVQEFVSACETEFICGRDIMSEHLFFLVAAFAFQRNLDIFRAPARDNAQSRNRIAIHQLVAATTGKRARLTDNDLCAWMTNFQGWECFDPLDKIYAFIGMVENSSIVPKYELTDKWPEVYADVAFAIFQQRNNLDFICVGQGEGRHYKLMTTWVPDLTMAHGTSPALPPIGCMGRAVFRASAGSGFSGQRIENRLRLWGVSFAKVKQMSLLHDKGQSGVRDSMRLAYGSGGWKRERPYAHKSDHTNEVAMVRTLCWDLNYERKRCGDNETFVERSPEDPIPASFKPELDGDERRAAFEVAMSEAATRYRLLRRFAILEHDYMAMVPPDTREGDLVCVFAGATVPMVIRQYRSLSHYQFVGACYVHGVMGGELWPPRKLEQFEIL